MYTIAKALNAPKWLQSSLIYVTKHGSQAYGTALPDSDTDIRGVCIPPKPYWYGFAHNFEQFEHKGDDLTIFGIRKFFQLAANANPNVLELLFTDPADHLWINGWGEQLLAHRDLFLSQKIKHSFSGYAVGQLKRIRTHRKWLLNPPGRKPERGDFGLLETKLVPREIVGAFEALGDTSMVPADVMAVFHKERVYLNALREWQQYENWKKTRNKARAELEAKFGYDCYLDDTEFLTMYGWKRYDDITERDLLGTINPVTGVLEYQYWTDRVAKAYSGDLFELNSRDTHCVVTPNHRMWVSSLSRQKSNGWTTKYDDKTSLWHIQPMAELVKGRKSFFHVRTTATPHQHDLAVSDEMIILVGAYVSEGCVGKRVKNGAASVLRISQKEGGRLVPFMERFRDACPQYTRRFLSEKKKRLSRNYLDYCTP